MSFRSSHHLALLLALTAVACGSGSDGNQEGAGTVTDQWRSYCVAKFTQDYRVTEFNEPLFTARAGEDHLRDVRHRRRR
jgi:hypothetical protein